MVAVDGSKHSENVVDVSCRLAKKIGSSIVLCHITRKMPEEPEGIKEFEDTERYQEAYASYLQEVGKEVTVKLGKRIEEQTVPFEAMTEFGNPAERILEIASLQNAEMIVLGLHGMHYIGLIRSLGSVARRVIENANCPVLVVP